MSSTPPTPFDGSFDAIFQNQAQQRQSSQSSQWSNNISNHHQSPFPTDQNQPMMDEPHSFSRRDSSASLGNHSMGGHSRSASASRAPAHQTHHMVGGLHTPHMQDSGVWRKDSLPFDPVSSSTLIATAQQAGPTQTPPQGNFAGNDAGYYGNSSSALPPSSPYNFNTGEMQQGQYDQNQNQYQAWNGGESSSTGAGLNYDGYGPNPNSGFGNGNAQIGADGQQNMFGQSPNMQGMQGNMNSGMQDMGQGSFQAGSGEFGQAGQGNVDWSSEFIEQGTSSTPDNMINQSQMSELERIISQSSHPSREPSPAPQQANFNSQPYIPAVSPDPNMNQAFTPALTSRSTSPFAPPDANQNTGTPDSSGLPRRSHSPSPNPSSPFFNKPQSPPALIIPNQSGSTNQFPPIVTTTNDSMPQNNQQGNAAGVGGLGGPVGLGRVSGGLQIPADPALKGITGMEGISPIAPSADGPQIYIQPSTPISGLKDGRGVFDAVLRRSALQQANQNASQQQGVQNQEEYNNAAAMHGQNQGSQYAQSNGGNGQNNQQAFGQSTFDWSQMGDQSWGGLRPMAGNRPRAKSDSQMIGAGGDGGFDRNAFMQSLGGMGNMGNMQDMFVTGGFNGENNDQLRSVIDQWRAGASFANLDQNQQQATLDPRTLPGSDLNDNNDNPDISRQLSALQAQRDRLPALNTALGQRGNQQNGGTGLSPTSLAFYQQLGITPGAATQMMGTASAPYNQTKFEDLPQTVWPQTAALGSGFLAPEAPGMGSRRRSFAEGQHHPAAGAGTPGYGVEFNQAQFGTLSPGKIRGVGNGGGMGGHRRGAKSEDWGAPTGWGVGAGGSTTDFLNSITANDGTLLPPSRGRSHSRHSSVSSNRSASPALSISSQGSSYGASPRMDMPDGVNLPGESGGKIAKMRVTSMATEVASTSRRTNEGVFACPVPGCHSTFTRHFNLKGHLRSHNDERPYKCLYDGCPKAIVGFARQHDCKRHMLLHEGLRPYECEGCGKKFARLDALTRHHKSEQGQECAITHPLPVNPDGSAMSESQYKAYKAAQQKNQPTPPKSASKRGGRGGGRGRGRISSISAASLGDKSGEEDIGNGSGMEEYERY